MLLAVELALAERFLQRPELGYDSKPRARRAAATIITPAAATAFAISAALRRVPAATAISTGTARTTGPTAAAISTRATAGSTACAALVTFWSRHFSKPL